MAESKSRTARTSREAMDFYAELDAPTRVFLKEDQKQQLADEEIPFMVELVEVTSSKQYGDRWELTITGDLQQIRPEDANADDRIILTLPSHGARDRVMMMLEKAVRSAPVGPLILTSSEIDDGKTWLALKKAEKA